jgi:hypothetical protein
LATIETLRPESQLPPAGGVAEPRAALAAFRSGRDEERLTDLLAFALATDAGEAAGAGGEAVARHRREAERELHDHAFRFLHNRVEEIRREAVAEHVSRQPRPPGFLRLVLANLVAIGIAGAAGLWLSEHPDAIAAALRALGV